MCSKGGPLAVLGEARMGQDNLPGFHSTPVLKTHSSAPASLFQDLQFQSFPHVLLWDKSVDFLFFHFSNFPSYIDISTYHHPFFFFSFIGGWLLFLLAIFFFFGILGSKWTQGHIYPPCSIEVDSPSFSS